MNKGTFLNEEERFQCLEGLAREIYAMLGYSDISVARPNYMAESTHPAEMACYRLAKLLVAKLMNPITCEEQFVDRLSKEGLQWFEILPHRVARKTSVHIEPSYYSEVFNYVLNVGELVSPFYEKGDEWVAVRFFVGEEIKTGWVKYDCLESKTQLVKDLAWLKRHLAYAGMNLLSEEEIQKRRYGLEP